jgi:hypothetical protein
MAMTKIYLDILDIERKKVFSKLKCLTNKGTLAGGTALSLLIKHRYSFDFDVFFEKHVIQSAFGLFSQKVEIQEKRVEQPNQITFLTKNGVQITFFYYEFLPLYPKIKTSFLPLFDVKDIAADKAYTLGRRPIWRDYVDLFFLLKDNYITLPQMIKDAQKKFKAGFAPKLFLEQLTYWRDIQEFKIDFVDKEYSVKEIQEFLKKEVLLYTKRKLEF